MNIVHALPAEEGMPKVSYTTLFVRLQKLDALRGHPLYLLYSRAVARVPQPP